VKVWGNDVGRCGYDIRLPNALPDIYRSRVTRLPISIPIIDTGAQTSIKSICIYEKLHPSPLPYSRRT